MTSSAPRSGRRAAVGAPTAARPWYTFSVSLNRFHGSLDAPHRTDAHRTAHKMHCKQRSALPRWPPRALRKLVFESNTTAGGEPTASSAPQARRGDRACTQRLRMELRYAAGRHGELHAMHPELAVIEICRRMSSRSLTGNFSTHRSATQRARSRRAGIGRRADSLQRDSCPACCVGDRGRCRSFLTRAPERSLCGDFALPPETVQHGARGCDSSSTFRRRFRAPDRNPSMASTRPSLAYCR